MRGGGLLLGRAEQEAAGGGARVAVQHQEQQRVHEGVHEGDVESHLPAAQFHVYLYAMFKAPVDHSVLNVKALVGTFNKEEALVGRDCETANFATVRWQL